MTPDALKAALAEHARWRRGDGGKRLDMRGAVLRDAVLRDADLRDAVLIGADLSGAVLIGAVLIGAVLRDADLIGAVLRDADLRDAVLIGAVLIGADLAYVKLRDADLRGANLRDAVLSGAVLRDADLNGAVLRDANLNGIHGNMREIKSAQFDQWPVSWITDPDTGPILQIGCQRHPLEMWEKAEPRWLAKMDPKATEWADKYLSLVCQLVRASPAVPHGRATQ